MDMSRSIMQCWWRSVTSIYANRIFSFLSERETADRNYALSYYMREYKVKVQKTGDFVYYLP
jgi:hypothetical protein